MRVLVTGANGFVGAALCRRLLRDGQDEVVAAVRRAVGDPPGISPLVIGEINGQTSWAYALRDVDVVVHLAARVHQPHEKGADQFDLYRAVNTEGTLNLARQAVASGVRRFVFISSVKVCGEGQADAAEPPYSETSACNPVDAYGRSKLEAELGLREIAAASGLEVVIMRPPLVYGPGVKANFLRLMQWIDRGLPLPFGGIENRRDLVYVENLVDAIATCLVHPAAVGRTFFVSDGARVSTPELIRRLASALGRPARLVSVPPAWLRALGVMSGKRAAVDRLLGSLMVDDGAMLRELGWQRPYAMDEGVRDTASWYLNKQVHAETTV